KAELDSLRFRLRQLFRGTIQKAKGIVELALIERGAVRPADGLAFSGEMQVIAGARRDLAHRKGFRVAAKRDLATGGKERRHIRVVVLGKGHPAPVWRDAIFGDPLADKMLARIITLQIDAAERQARVAAPRKQNALAVGGKLRIA